MSVGSKRRLASPAHSIEDVVPNLILANVPQELGSGDSNARRRTITAEPMGQERKPPRLAGKKFYSTLQPTDRVGRESPRLGIPISGLGHEIA